MKILYSIAVFACAIFLYSSTLAAPVEAKQKDWTLNLKDVDITVFLEQVSSITGENFVVDPQVKGKVSASVCI